MGEPSRIRETIIYYAAGVLTLVSFLFFAFVPLPRAYYPEIIFHRPEEFVPAFFFLMALIGYLRKGYWAFLNKQIKSKSWASNMTRLQQNFVGWPRSMT